MYSTRTNSSEGQPMMRTRRFATAVLITAFGFGGSLAGTPIAAASPQAGCQYKVVWPTAGVYENPNPNSAVVKTKYAGDIVGAATCEGASYNEYGYVLVATDAAADGRGWMREGAVVAL
ncbi:glycosyltransferase [Streptomyces poriferorum]|uniref:Glycosyltransferase n=1 Tax=Streptomyces poriferorum TaxID=2798799 RepID=A0ABY9IHF9_9ACTN|nr:MULTISPECIES: glycosyltransferase [Streptomyces]MDP5315740.1 glycosyltransferase [Streptomyces sp. Alt4]WLQ53138.1 glycosyltransferase [Streptomyces sp. Alt1]WLQ54101.1 glycosyltransferase [Streptomyces sp. Alt2]WSI68030.1 glycosyltransferase [Streptomyces sp. NBC_01336]